MPMGPPSGPSKGSGEAATDGESRDGTSIVNTRERKAYRIRCICMSGIFGLKD
jgi:hypothetical protein